MKFATVSTGKVHYTAARGEKDRQRKAERECVFLNSADQAGWATDTNQIRNMAAVQSVR